MRRLLCAVAALFVAGVSWGSTGTQSQYVRTMTFQDGVAPTAGYSGSEFTFINSSAADSGKNFGAADTLYLSGQVYSGPFHAGTSKILGKFDISALPDSAVIVDAKLYMYQYTNLGTANADTLITYRVFPPWTEGTGAQAGTASVVSATWTTRHVNDSPADVFTLGGWGVNGCSNLSTGSASKFWATTDSTVAGTFSGIDTIDVKSSGVIAVDRTSEGSTAFLKTGASASARYGWVTIDMTHQAKLWHIGANTNNGFVVEMHSATQNRAFKFFSDNKATVNYRPKLVIQYLDPETLESASGGSSSSSGRRTLGGVSGLH